MEHFVMIEKGHSLVLDCGTIEARGADAILGPISLGEALVLVALLPEHSVLVSQ